MLADSSVKGDYSQLGTLDSQDRWVGRCVTQSYIEQRRIGSLLRDTTLTFPSASLQATSFSDLGV